MSFTPWGIYDSDKGFSLGTFFTYTMYGFKRSPFTYQHRIGYNYIQGFVYQGISVFMTERNRLNIDATISSRRNFTISSASETIRRAIRMRRRTITACISASSNYRLPSTWISAKRRGWSCKLPGKCLKPRRPTTVSLTSFTPRIIVSSKPTCLSTSDFLPYGKRDLFLHPQTGRDAYRRLEDEPERCKP